MQKSEKFEDLARKKVFTSQYTIIIIFDDGQSKNLFFHFFFSTSETRKKSPIVYKSCPKVISLEKGYILAPLQKLPKNLEDLDKLFVVEGFKFLPKVE